MRHVSFSLLEKAPGSTKLADRRHKREHDEEEAPPSKKRRVSLKVEEKLVPETAPVPEPKSNPLGAIIGRKRKERKGGKK